MKRSSTKRSSKPQAVKKYTAKQLGLFSTVPGASLAAYRISVAIAKAKEATGRGMPVQAALKAFVYPALNKDAKFGAADSEPYLAVREILGDRSIKYRAGRSAGRKSKAVRAPTFAKGKAMVALRTLQDTVFDECRDKTCQRVAKDLERIVRGVVGGSSRKARSGRR